MVKASYFARVKAVLKALCLEETSIMTWGYYIQYDRVAKS